MANLLSHLDSEDRKWLDDTISNNQIYDLPSMEEVIEYLTNTSDDEPSEEVLGDLIIQYLEDEGLMFDFC